MSCESSWSHPEAGFLRNVPVSLQSPPNPPEAPSNLWRRIFRYSHKLNTTQIDVRYAYLYDRVQTTITKYSNLWA